MDIDFSRMEGKNHNLDNSGSEESTGGDLGEISDDGCDGAGIANDSGDTEIVFLSTDDVITKSPSDDEYSRVSSDYCGGAR